MTKEFEKRIAKEEIVDTAKYRYRVIGGTIYRIGRDFLDTVDALNIKSDLNPNGWEMLKAMNK